MRNSKKILIILAMLLVVGTTSLSAYPSHVPKFWHGDGDGVCYYNNGSSIDTIEVFGNWQGESTNENTNGVYGCIYDPDDPYWGVLDGIIEEGTGNYEYKITGTWELCNPDLGGAPYDGTFVINVDSVNTTTWNASGTWTATHEDLGNANGTIIGHGHFTEAQAINCNVYEWNVYCDGDCH